MKGRIGSPAVRASSLAALCGYWVWALLASPDSRVVLDGRLRLPVAGVDVAAGAFFIAAPLVAFAAFLAVRLKDRTGWPALVPFPAALFLNAFRCLKLHDPVISYIAAGMALAGTAWAFRARPAPRPIRRKRVSVGNILAAAGGMTALGIEGILVLFLIPWSLRGNLPGGLNNYPFGPAMRSVLYASLAGYERPAGSGPRSLRGIRLEGADMSRAVFKGIDLRGARLYRARLDLADFEGADLRGAHLEEARMSFISLRGADLSAADMSGVYSMGADLRNAVLRGSFDHSQRFVNADARGADFRSARLSSAQFFGSDLRGASFRDAGFPDAILVRARLDGADLTGASLPRADLNQAVLRGALLGNADLDGALNLVPDALGEAASLRGAKLEPALLDELRRRFPSLF